MKKRPNEVRPRVFVRFYWALALACGLAMSPASAPAQQQSTWTNVSSGMWTNATRWSNGVPNGVGTIAVFAGGNSGAAAVTNNVAITNSAIIFIPTAGNSYTISSNSSGGILYLQGSGGSALIQAGSASINNSANQILNIPLVMLSNLIMSNLLTSGTLTVGGGITNSGFNLTLEDTGPTTLSGPISGSGGLTKKGTGVLTLSGANTYSGGTLISAGALQGTIAGLQGGITNNASLVFYGSSGGIYGGVISGSGALTISNNTGQVTIFTNQNTFTGATLIQQGGLTLSNSLGAIGNTASLTLLAGTTLQLDNRGVSNFNRIAGVPLTIQGATLTVLGGGTNNVGAITFGTGGSVISNVASFISTPTLSRGAGFATVNFTGGGTNLFTTQAGASNAILPWAFIKGADFATHDGDGTALRAFTNYSSTFAADTNVKATTVNSVGGMTINSLVLGTNLTVTTDQTLTNTSGGMILTLANQFITNGSLRFSAEAIVENESAATVYSTLVTPSGLTKTGAGTLTLMGTNQNAGGILRVNQGSFTVGEGGVVNGGDVLVNVGTFNMNGGAATLNSLVVTNATPSATANLTLGYGTLTTTNGVIVNNNASLVVGGVVGKTMTWNMFGGTNVTGTAGGSLSVSVGGLNFVANTGLVVVAGPTTVWSNNMTLWLGGNLSATGHINSVGQMAISNGAVVYVTGSSGTTSGLAVGSQGSGSSLLLADGGKLYYTGANAFSVGPNTSSSNNTILVTGSGSVLNTTTNRPINIGTKSSGGGGNQITVASNATVITAGLAMGGAFNSSGAGTGSDGGVGSNNTVLVYGDGTVWSNANGASAVFVGFSGAGNRLIVSNDAIFASLGNLTVANTGGTSNQLLVLDGGQVKAPTVVIGNGSGSFNSMVIASRGTVVSTVGTSTLGNATGGNSNSVLVTGSGSIWNNAGNLTVGYASDIVGNQLTVSSSGQVINATGKIGGSARANSNWAAVVGSGSLWSNTSSFVVGGSGSFNQLMVSNGGRVIGTSVMIGELSGGNSNSVWVTDGGVLQSSGGLTLGAVAASVGNTLTIANGGKVYSGGNSVLGSSKGAPLGKVILTGGGSLWTNSSLLFSGQSNELYVLDGAVMQGFNTFVGENTSGSMSSNNTVVVADRGAWTNLGSLYVGAFGNGNRFVVTNGGTVYVAGNVSVGYINSNPSGAQVISNNQLLVSGSTSRMTVGSNIYVGHGSATSKSFYDMGSVIVSNGATLTAGAVAVGIDVRNSNNLFVVSGAGTLVQLSVGLMVGSNSGTINNSSSVNGLGSTLVHDGAALEANWLQAGYNNTGVISNLGGVYQFTTNTPKIVANTIGAIVVNNGTIAFRGITNADVMGSLGSNQISKISFSGTNTFRLNSASNTFAASPQNYTFGYSSANPSNYAGLEMINEATAWKSAWLAISNNGSMLVSNTSASILGVLTNSGQITVTRAAATYASNVVLASGSTYTSTRGTNTFSGGLVVGASALLKLDDFSQVLGTVTNNGIVRFINVGTITNSMGALAGTGSLDFNQGTIYLTNANSYSGGTLISGDGARAALGADAALGTGTITLTGHHSALSSIGSATRTLGNDLVFSTNVTLGSATDTGALILNGGVSLGGATRTLSVSNAVTINGAVANGGLTLDGGSILTLAGANTYAGATTINGATLKVNGTNTSSAITINSGGILMGSGKIGTVAVASGGTLSPGNSPGTLTVGDLTFGGGGNYNWQVYDAAGTAGTGYDTLSSSGTLTISATSGDRFNLNLWSLSAIGPDANGNAINFNSGSSYTWTIGSFSSISGFSADKFNLVTNAVNGTGGFANTLNGGSFSLATAGGLLNLLYTPLSLGGTFVFSAGTGNWGTAGNWTNNAAPPSTGATIEFSGAGGTSSNDAASSVQSLAFNSGAGSYLVNGNALALSSNAGVVNNSVSLQTINNNLTLGTNAAFTAARGNLAFGGTISNGGYLLTLDGSNNLAMVGAISGSGALLKSGLGVASLSGANGYTGGTTVSNGTLALLGSASLASRVDVIHGATLQVSNATATLSGVVTNQGTISVVNSHVTYAAPVVLSGGYVSDPSTNIFAANVTVAPDGYLVGGRVVSNADLFVFEKDLLMLSTNRLFDVSQAGFLFTNSANHLLSISNSGALNIGQGYASFAQVASNFAIGTLSIASGNRLTLSGLTNGPVTNALYVGWLDIQGWSTNSGYASVTNSLLMALNLPDVNLFYNKYDARNQWLNEFIPDTGYDLWGAGLLLPIPEPSPFLAVAAGLAFLAFLRRRRAS